jgi:aspartyl-tRNA synthetase
MERTLALQAPDKIDEEVLLYGWVNSIREHGNVVFIDLRDRSGIVQLVGNEELAELAKESVIKVNGKVALRDEKYFNNKLETGKVEVKVDDVEVLAESKTPPFDITSPGLELDERVRLKYRYLDLRRKRMQRNLRDRSRFINLCRQFLFKNDFTEIETPLLTKSTPEGARDFLVPSRLQPGKFYALPQSPQQYKQLLMSAGFERYFQIARCLRDEDLRADRGFEHSQIDIEMSFVEQKDVMGLVEKMFIDVFKQMGAKIKEMPFPVFTYQEAIKKFGADKFDLRSDKEKKDGTLAFAWVKDFPFFEKKNGGWTFTHNPFSDPIPEHKQKLLNGEIENILTTQYDLVCNGFEVGGGSIRANEPQILSKVFEVLGYSKDEIEEQFSHMLEAFEYGTPPHGGIACGVERLIMVLENEASLKEVVAFPQTSSGKTAVMDAPSKVNPEQLKELGIKLRSD